MVINLFLDDLRECPEGFVLARNYDECIALLSASEINVLSMDHDLGEGPSGYGASMWVPKRNTEDILEEH